VAIGAMALKLHRRDKGVALELLKMPHNLSFFWLLDAAFATSTAIPLIAKTVSVSDDCVSEMCAILGNVIGRD